MMKSSRAAEQRPPIPPRRRSLIHTRKFPKNVAFNLPDSHQLIITTSRSVFIWRKDGVLPVFQSATNGILAARKTVEGGESFAVADSQVVLLHDMRKGNERTYKLKGSDGHVRLLRYAQDTTNLYFTTTLQNAVLAYSLKDDKLLAPTCDHPSPPTVIALSPDSHWLLSASVAPPTILLNNLLLHSSAVIIRPQCSSAAVVAAAFHPERTNILLLAFMDGACAIYDVAHLISIAGRVGNKANQPLSGTRGELSYIKRLHTIASSTPLSNIEMGSLGPGLEHTNHGVGEIGVGISAVAFVPGSRARAVTVGADGRCCVVNFFIECKKKGSVLRSWHIQGRATSLALLSTSFKHISDGTGQNDGNGLKQPRKRVLVAIGRQDGIVLLYDLGGHLLRDREFSLDGSRIIELEWTSDKDRIETRQPDSDLAVPSVVPIQQKRKSVGELPGSSIPTPVIVSVIDGANDEIGTSLLDSLARVEQIQEPGHQGYRPRSALNHLDCFNPASQNTSYGEDRNISKNPAAPTNPDKPNRGKPKNSKPLHGKVSPGLQTGLEGPPLSRAIPDQTSILPPIPPRPIKKKAGGPSLSHAEKGKPVTSAAAVESYPAQHDVLDDTNTPRELPRSSLTNRLDVIAINHAAANSGHDGAKILTDQDKIIVPTIVVDNDDHAWMDITASSRRPGRKLNGKPARIEKRNDRKGSSALQSTPAMASEASNDIVVDWSPASTHLVVPPGSLLPQRLPEIPPRATKSRKKPSTESFMSNGTVVQWSSFKKGHIFAMPNKTSVRKIQPPRPTLSSNMSPKNELNATSTKHSHEFLTETSHNPTQAQQQQQPVLESTISSPPTRPPPPPPLHSWTSTTQKYPKPAEPNLNNDGNDDPNNHQLQIKINNLRDEIVEKFQVEQIWFDAQLQVLREESRKMEDENRRLRQALARALLEMEKGKGVVRGVL